MPASSTDPGPAHMSRRSTKSRLQSRSRDINMLQIGDFIALTGPDETAVSAAAELAAGAITWEGGNRPPDNAADPHWLMQQPVRDRVVQGSETAASTDAATLTALYSRPYIAHASIGPSCALALFTGGHLTIYSHTQGVFQLRTSIARALKMEPSSISVIHRPGAGCYGHNGADDVAFDAALIAVHMPDRFVRVLWSRADELAASPVGAAQAVKLSASLGADGRPASWTIELWAPTHAQRPCMGGGVNLLGAMALPDPPPQPEPADVPDASGGGGRAQRRRALRPARPARGASFHPELARADLGAAESRRFRQCVRHRELHRRAGREGWQRSPRIPPRSDNRTAQPRRHRESRGHGRLVGKTAMLAKAAPKALASAAIRTRRPGAAASPRWLWRRRYGCSRCGARWMAD